MIHIGKNQLKMDEQSYRANLVSLTGKRSCLDMGVLDLIKVLDFLKSKGFKFKSGKSGKSEQRRAPTQLDKLRHIWITMNHHGFLRDGSDSALNSWCITQTKRLNNGTAIAKLEWIKGSMLSTLIEQLKAWHIRLLNEQIDSQYPAVALLSQEGELLQDNYQKFIELDGQLKASQSHESLVNVFNGLSKILAHNQQKSQQALD